MVIALALAIAAGLLIKDADQQPLIMQVINYVRAPKTAEVQDTGTTGVVADEVAITGSVVDPTAEVAVDPTTGSAVDEVAITGSVFDEVAITGSVVDPTAEVVVDPTVTQ